MRQFAKCELIIDFFSEQSNLDDSNSTVPEPIDPLYDKLTQLHITETDIEDVLQLLDTTKTTGTDLINPRLIRGFHFVDSRHSGSWQMSLQSLRKIIRVR